MTPDAPDVQVLESETLPELSQEQSRFLKPSRGRLPPDPEHTIEWSAYTLEPGEWRIGLGLATVGLFPRVQVGTSPALAAFGIVDLSARWDLIRVGPVDLAMNWRWDGLHMGDLTGRVLSVGPTVSARLAEGWGAHIGGTYGQGHAQGVPTQLPPILRPFADPDLLDVLALGAAVTGIDPVVDARFGVVRLATDLRVNKRDGFVIQGQGLVWGDVSADLGENVSPELLSALQVVVPTLSGDRLHASKGPGDPLGWVVTLSYTASLGHADVRVGGGVSPTDLAWILQANDVALRGGGKSSRADNKRKKGWKRGPQELRGVDTLAASREDQPFVAPKEP